MRGFERPFFSSKREMWLVSGVTAALVCILVTSVAFAIDYHRLSKLVPATVNVVNTPLPADINGDGTVDASDIALVASVFNTFKPSLHAADLNGDGFVDIYDLVIVGINYGRSRIF